MPSRKEIQWSELRVGALVMVAMAVLIGLIFLMSRTTGGLFAEKLVFRSYFANASGLKEGAPVTLEGVTIGNVMRMRIVTDRNPYPVEVTMQVGHEYLNALHTDSTASISQAGVLGDSYVDLDSSKARGPEPKSNAELTAAGSPSIQDVIRSSQGSIEEVGTLMHKIETLVDTLNSENGSVGEFINNRQLYNKITQIADNLNTITGSISGGKGSIGKLLTDDTLYTRANGVIDKLNDITTGLDEGKGTAGKFLRDDQLYKNLSAAAANANQLLADANAGKGAIGKLAKDPEFAKKLDDTVSSLDTLLKGINEGKGTLGQLAVNHTLYDHLDQTADQSQQLIKAIHENPKKYFVIRLKMF